MELTNFLPADSNKVASYLCFVTTQTVSGHCAKLLMFDRGGTCMWPRSCAAGAMRVRGGTLEEGVELVLCILDATDGKSFAARVAA